ncbi:MAG: SpoIIE family protein phosphatase [Candidatus Brocadiae bacterium]|nr:SpoIIE family protein phosphatase [Candidatus Brocadiia bacterium]
MAADGPGKAGAGKERMPTKRWMRDEESGDESGGRAQGFVLVAEPDAGRRQAYARALSDMGFTTRATGSGNEALEILLSDDAPDAFVIDVDLPDQSGLQILSQLTRRKLTIPAVIATRGAHQHAFEVMSYPKKTFLAVRDADLIALAVRQILPTRRPAAGKGETDLSAEERARCREIQEMLVVQELPDFPGWESAALYQPCSVVGGDYLDIFPLPNGRVGIVVADVSGHGFPGAMIMVMVRTAFRLIAPALGPRETVVEVNRFVTNDIKKRMFVSAMYAVMDPLTGHLEILNCGQNPPLLVSARSGPQLVKSSGLAMGLNSGSMFEKELKVQAVPVEIGDHLLLYTDGVVEAKNARGEDLGDDTLLEISRRSSTGNAQDMVDSVAEAIVEHRGMAAQSDDITIVAFKRLSFIGSADAPTLLDSLE